MKPWIVKLVCCGRDDGEYRADTYEEAYYFRESYTNGVSVNPHGYSAGEHEPGHKRAGIITCDPGITLAQGDHQGDHHGGRV